MTYNRITRKTITIIRMRTIIIITIGTTTAAILNEDGNSVERKR